MNKINCILIIIAIVSFSETMSQTDFIDFSFGNQGYSRTSIMYHSECEGSVVVQRDGKILVTGSLINSFGNSDIVLVRYNSNGNLDVEFGNNGKAVADIINSNETGKSISIQNDGKIIVAGTVFINNNNYDIALVRFNINGTLDNSFGIGGKVTTDFNNTVDVCNSVITQSDGKIIVAGSVRNISNYYYISNYDTDFALVRYNPDGSLDSSFGINGKIITDFGKPNDQGNSVKIQEDGKIVVAGSSVDQFYSSIALARYNTDGTIDTSFDDDGKVKTSIGGENIANSMQVQNDGKIVVTGYCINGYNRDFALVRYNTNGSLDTTFGNYGKVQTALGGNDEAKSVLIQNDGKIVVVGNADNRFILVRYNTNGVIDSSFGDLGKITSNFGSLVEQAFSISLQNDGKLVVAGTVWNGGDSNDFLLARYLESNTITGKINNDLYIET